MLRRTLHCPICGDTWKRVIHENFVRLGPPVRECRACWSPFNTEQNEWNALDTLSRVAFFLQNLVIVVPLLLILLLAIAIAWFEDMIGVGDAVGFFGWGSLICGSLVLLLWVRALFLILFSKMRSSRAQRGGQLAPRTRRSSQLPTGVGPSTALYPETRPRARANEPAKSGGQAT
jgi:hypothetical protein